MNILSIIGTRPQYVKIKPLYDHLLSVDCRHVIVDTNQHYSKNVSSIFIDEFGLEIDYNLSINNINPVIFISKTIESLSPILCSEKPDIVLVFGDTNTTLAGALASNKMGFAVGHIESGMRCGSRKRPEEINRIITDELSDIHFLSRRKDHSNVRNPVYSGDLEFVLLTNMFLDKKIPERRFDDYVLMTIHREENTYPDRIRYVFDMCRNTKENFLFPMHHRTKILIYENDIDIPVNIRVIDPVGYLEMVCLLQTCKAIFSDSGGLAKVSPFFGKKCLVPLDCTEYDDLVEHGYIKCGLDFDWLLGETIEPYKNIYYVENSCHLIYDSIVRFLS